MITALLFTFAASAEPAPPEPERTSLEEERRALDAEREALREEIRSLRDEIRGLRDEEAAESAERAGFGEPVVVAVGEEVDEVVSFGDDVNVAGHVLGDAVSFGGNVVIVETGRVDGDAVSFGGRVEVRDGGRLNGDRVAMGIPSGLAPIPLSAISATSEPEEPHGVEDSSVGSLPLTTDARALFHSLYRKAVWVLSIAGAGVLVIGLFPNRVGRVAQDLESRPIRAAVVGMLSAGFLTIFSLLFTVVTLGLGLPVGLLLMGLLGLAWLLGFVGLCQAVGDRLPFEERPHGRWLAFLVGVLLLSFFGSLPWIGWIVVAVASVVGIGAAFSTRFGRA